MTENNTNIQMRLVSVNEVSFMMSPDKMADDVNPASVQIGFSNRIQSDVEDDKISLVFGIKYESGGEAVLDSVYRFEYDVKGLARFITVHENGGISVTHIMPHLIGVAVGTMRGILIVKTAGTNLSKFPVPMIDPNQLNADLCNRQE